ncbi:RNA-binding domain-containing protein [Guyanagaster necrorhizus]|uniref:RNA-binding domain-containing protein n=1 Tax=Guyanagaster necrorhizus TaxID=856835 RepID=A0A9P7VXG6_9AGAR|nr:RNA-binding domain-containing protein [Guyanagaster necrorhizus MCA 3950]KAG7447611.1 RNA-binding domain-containing protein [Guyanagaster necrorhizus MCA 3950]
MSSTPSAASSTSSSSRNSSLAPSSDRLKRKRGSSSSDEDEPSHDDPVLSHAEKRRQKKKEKSETDQRSKAKKAKLDVSGKRQNSVWVGNLSYKTTTDALRTFFEGVGEVMRIHMPTKPSAKPGVRGENRGFAYVDFASPEAKTAAIGLSERHLIGRKLLIKDGDDFEGRPSVPAVEDNKLLAGGKNHSKSAQKILRAQKQPPAPTLFLGNLGFDTTNDSIRQLFEGHRSLKEKDKAVVEAQEAKDPWIRKIRMGTFEDSGACKGFAFVDFSSVENATAALINIKNHHMNGRDLVVEYASADAVRRGASKPKGPDAPEKRKRPFDKSKMSQGPNRGRKLVRDAGMEEDTVKERDEDPHPPPHLNTAVGNERRGRVGPANSRSRPRPGAALAQAQRQSAAILPTSNSKKITF